MNKKYLLNIILKLSLIAISLSFILIIEVLSAYLYKEKEIDLITEILDEDVHFFWRQKSFLNQEFHGARITTDDKGFRLVPESPPWELSRNRIIVMGASPCFGWGVEDNQTYSALLQKKFNLSFPLKSVSFFNASQIGYSSFQGRNLFDRELLSKKPTHILISYVLNDLDYYRFFRNSSFNDKSVEKEAPYLVITRNFFRHLNSFRLLNELLQKVNQFSFSADKSLNTIADKNPRVSLEDYKKNLISIILTANKNQVRPILIKFPVNLPSPYKNDSDALFEKAKILSDIKTMGSSEIQVRLKLVESYFISKNSLLYNKTMEDISALYKVPIVDIVKAFKNNKDYLFIDPHHDTIHPNVQGHQTMADEIYSVLNNTLIDTL